MRHIGERFIRALEELYVALFAWIPTPAGTLLRLLAWRCCFRKCGSVRFGTSITLGHMRNISLGRGCRIGRLCFLTAGNGVLTLDDNAAISPCVHLSADEGEIHIGKNVAIGPGTVIRAANHRFDRRDRPIMLQGHERGAVTIEEDVWIGANCVILPGVNIGKGAVVGAGAVVTRSVAPFTVVGGVPARPIGLRPED